MVPDLVGDLNIFLRAATSSASELISPSALSACLERRAGGRNERSLLALLSQSEAFHPQKSSEPELADADLAAQTGALRPRDSVHRHVRLAAATKQAEPALPLQSALGDQGADVFVAQEERGCAS